MASSKQSPRPSLIDCRAGGACCFHAFSPTPILTLRCPLLAVYTSTAAFSENLVKCMQNDWQLGADALLALFPSALKVAGKAYGLDMSVEFLKAELKKDSQTALQTIMDAYLQLVMDSHKKRKKGDPWPVIIVDEANLLTSWKDDESLKSLLTFFVYLTKQKQLAHVILATSDTFLTQWLEKGAPCLAGEALSRFLPLRVCWQVPSSARSAPRSWWATWHARRRARTSLISSCPFTRSRPAPPRRGSAYTRCAAATPETWGPAPWRWPNSAAGSLVRMIACLRFCAAVPRIYR